LFAFGILSVAVSAEEAPETPAYEPKEHKIEAIVAAIESGKEYYLMPTDTIVLPVQSADDTDEPTAAADGEATVADTLIVDYLPGDGAESTNKMTKFTDMQKSGYAVKDIGDYTDFAFEGAVRNTNYAIDYQSIDGYTFKQWKVTSVYSGKEFSRVTVEAEWNAPVLSGWAGWQTMRKAYIKTFIDTLFAYITGLLNRISSFLV
jgi:hypothetical protein